MKRRYLVLALLLIPLVVWAAAPMHFGARETLTHVIDQTGDTAKVYKLHQFTARDSFVYIDTVVCTSTKIAVKWTSHPTIRRIAVGATIDTTHIDTLIVDLGTNTDTIAYDVPQIEGFTRAAYIDTIVARFNALTETVDTVAAEDSGTYILLRGQIAQDDCEGAARWAIAFGTAAAADNNMAMADSTLTTVKMVCDSMTAAINATATVSDTVTAANSGDTVYTVSGDRAGWNFLCKPGDTAQDTTIVTAAKASSSYDYDTIYTGIVMWRNGWKNLLGNVVLYGSATTTKGYGTLDSVWYTLLRQTDTAGAWTTLLADSGTIPRRLHIAYSQKDTLFGYGPFMITVKVMDTATDTSGSRNHTLDWNFDAWGD